MKTTVSLLIICGSLLSQQQNSFDITLCIDQDCDGDVTISQSMSVQLLSIWVGASFQLWGNFGAPLPSLQLCQFFTELDPGNVFLLWEGSFPSTSGIVIQTYTLPPGVSVDFVIQAVVFIPNMCGYSVSQATYVHP